jgi:hypothetical protein
MDPLGSKRNTFASWMFLTRKAEQSHVETTNKLKKPSILLEKKEYSSAGRQFLIIWQDVQTQKQNLYSNSTFVSWDLDMVTSDNSASILIKELEELGVNLIRDAAMAFFIFLPLHKTLLRADLGFIYIILANILTNRIRCVVGCTWVTEVAQPSRDLVAIVQPIQIR